MSAVKFHAEQQAQREKEGALLDRQVRIKELDIQAQEDREDRRDARLAERLDPTIPMVHFICDAQFLHVSSSTAKELESVGEEIDWLVTPSVEAAFHARRQKG